MSEAAAAAGYRLGVYLELLVVTRAGKNAAEQGSDLETVRLLLKCHYCEDD